MVLISSLGSLGHVNDPRDSRLSIGFRGDGIFVSSPPVTSYDHRISPATVICLQALVPDTDTGIFGFGRVLWKIRNPPGSHDGIHQYLGLV